MNRLMGALILLLLFCPVTHAQSLAPGDLVRLKERDLHIPAATFHRDGQLFVGPAAALDVILAASEVQVLVPV